MLGVECRSYNVDRAWWPDNDVVSRCYLDCGLRGAIIGKNAAKKRDL